MFGVNVVQFFEFKESFITNFVKPQSFEIIFCGRSNSKNQLVVWVKRVFWSSSLGESNVGDKWFTVGIEHEFVDKRWVHLGELLLESVQILVKKNNVQGYRPMLDGRPVDVGWKMWTGCVCTYINLGQDVWDMIVLNPENTH